GGMVLASFALPSNLRKIIDGAPPARLDSAQKSAPISEIKHVVVLMQENRSFDHYFGAMPGVRGFADPAAIRLPGGAPGFRQPGPNHPQAYLAPFHLDTRTTSAQATPGTDHSWPTQHLAWNNGAMDRWVQAKGPFT